MSKKCFIVKLTLAVVMLMTVLFQTPVVMASPLSANQQITVFHSSPEKSFVVGKDVFEFRHLTSDAGRNVETVAIAEITLAPNYDGFLLKKHVVNFDESVYAIDGDIQCFAGQSDRAIDIKVNDLLRVPAGVPYGCKASGNKPSRLLVVSSSSALENLISEIGINGQPQIATEPDMKNVATVAQKYGIEFLN